MHRLNKFRAIISIIIISTFITSCFGKKPDISNKKRVITTIFPLYDWTRNILNEGNNENLLLNVIVKSGVDLHSYQASAADIMNISTADLFIYVGGESDKWIDAALASATNKNMIVLNLMDVLKEQLKVEEIIEGMETEEENDEKEEIEYDEHIWLSPENAILCCKAITEKLCQLDSENAAMYKEFSSKYIGKLANLDEAYKFAADNAKNRTFIFCDRFPFRYLLDQYGLNYYAAFPGCSAETEASFETVAFLSAKVEELNASAIYVTETSDKKIARTVISNAKKPSCDIIVIDSLQSTTLNQAFYGKSYIKTMENNLNAFKFN